jgi:uncharacterized protein involved in exopolysaccharide biosynthesis
LADAFDAFRYISYLRLRWRWIAISCVTAVAIAAGVSAIQQRRYTATARILIEPPAGTDLRSPLAISPIYLESLKTYESFALSDSLFRRAIDKFGLRPVDGGAPAESLKKRVLKVELVHNTRVLDVSATLPDPQKAQAVAQFIAESTVEMNRSLAASGDQDLIHSVEQQAVAARARRDASESAWTAVSAREPVDGLKDSLAGEAQLRGTLTEQQANAAVEQADLVDREKTAAPADRSDIRNQQTSVQARLDSLHKQIEGLDKRVAEEEKTLAERQGHRDSLDAQRKADQAVVTAVEARLQEARGDAGRRGERLTIIDPGIVPERPSSPNVPLNVVAALLLGLVLPLLYLTLEMSYREYRARSRRAEYYPAARQE